MLTCDRPCDQAVTDDLATDGRSGPASADPTGRKAWVIGRLEEAGRVTLSLPDRCPRSVTMNWQIVRSFWECYGTTPERAPVLRPTGEEIDRMDEAFQWIAAEPRVAIRRVLGLRCLIHPLTYRHHYSWREIGRLLGCDYRSVQLWHGHGVNGIVARLQHAGYFK